MQRRDRIRSERQPRTASRAIPGPKELLFAFVWSCVAPVEERGGLFIVGNNVNERLGRHMVPIAAKRRLTRLQLNSARRPSL
jgi:hypothetical protein